MKELSVPKAAPTHCGGDLVRQVFGEGYGEEYVQAGVCLSPSF